MKLFKTILTFKLKGRVTNFWKPMLIFEITKTNTALPHKGLTPILIELSHRRSLRSRGNN